MLIPIPRLQSKAQAKTKMIHFPSSRIIDYFCRSKRTLQLFDCFIQPFLFPELFFQTCANEWAHHYPMTVTKNIIGFITEWIKNWSFHPPPFYPSTEKFQSWIFHSDEIFHFLLRLPPFTGIWRILKNIV